MSPNETPPNDQPTILDFYRDHLEECKQLARLSSDPQFTADLKAEIEEYERKIARLESKQS